MRQQGSIDLFQYWNRLRAGRAAPGRTEIEPIDIKTLLADTFILEKDLRGDAVFRLAGTRVCATYGRELKGFVFPSLWHEKDRKLVARLTESVFEEKAVVVIAYNARSQAGRTVPLELVLLPLDGGLESPRLLGIVSACEKPYWLGADPIVETMVESVRVIDPDREPLTNRPAVTVPPLVPGEDAFVKETRTKPSARRVRHLLVLDGGRRE
jgi:hypothetical protein